MVSVFCARSRLLAGIVVILGLFLQVALSPGARTAAAPPGSVSGVVQNGTTNSKLAAGERVDLHTFDGSKDQVVASTQTDAGGKYLFSNVVIDDKLEYSVSVTFASVPYYSTPFNFSKGSQQVENLTVYNTTSSDAAISVARASLILSGVDSKRHLVTVVESDQILNSGTETSIGRLVGSQRQSLLFPLFPGAQSLTPEVGFSLADASTVGSGFALSVPVLPGENTIAFAYELPYSGSQINVNRVVAYKTAIAAVILPGQAEVSSPQLPEAGSIQLNGNSYPTIQGKNLAAGSTFGLDIRGLPVGASFPLPLNSLRTQILLLVTVVAAACLSVTVYRRRPLGTMTPLTTGEQGELLRRLAALDDQFAAGAVTPDAYERQRTDLKQRLLHVMQHGEAETPAKATPAGSKRTRNARRKEEGQS